MWRDGTILLVNALDTNIHQDLLLDTNRVSLYKIKQKELSEIEERQYKRLWDYKHIWEKSNPGSHIVLQVDNRGVPPSLRDYL